MIELDSSELRSTIEAGLSHDYTPYVQELDSILSVGRLERGVRLDLGNNLEALQRITDLVGIDEALSNESSHVVSVAVANGPGSTSIKGSLIGFVQTHGVPASLPLIQAGEWWPGARFTQLTSVITVDSDANPQDPPRPGATFQGVASYTTAQQEKFTKLYTDVLPEYGKEDANQFTRPDEARFPSHALARYMAATGEPIDIPMKKFFVSLGRISRGMMIDGVSSAQDFQLSSRGHFMPRKRRS